MIGQGISDVIKIGDDIVARGKLCLPSAPSEGNEGGREGGTEGKRKYRRERRREWRKK